MLFASFKMRTTLPTGTVKLPEWQMSIKILSHHLCNLSQFSIQGDSSLGLSHSELALCSSMRSIRFSLYLMLIILVSKNSFGVITRMDFSGTDASPPALSTSARNIFSGIVRSNVVTNVIPTVSFPGAFPFSLAYIRLYLIEFPHVQQLETN